MIFWIETDYAPSVPLQLSIYLPLTADFVMLLLAAGRAPCRGAMGAAHARI